MNTFRKHITRWVDYTIQTYCDNRAKLAIWFDSPVTINKWQFLTFVFFIISAIMFALLCGAF